MIQVICREEAYIYNAYHMTKAFYPSAEVLSRIEEKASNYVTINLDGKDVAFVSDKELEGYVNKSSCMAGGHCKEVFDRDDFVAKELKHIIDRSLYHQLERQTGHALSWGILMGVRPVKLAMKCLSEGMGQTEFIRWFEENYLVSREKSYLAWNIAVKEKALLDKLDTKDGYSLYVGIPFCPTICSYCSFSQGELSFYENRVDDYLDALCREIEFIAKKSEEKHLNTIYIGGGTPTTLNEEQLDRLLSCIGDHFSKEHLLEYTVEAGRADSITSKKLAVIKSHGITRISINPQTMQQKTLDRIGRRHTAEEVRAAFYLARDMGFDNINMDLIMGLEGETPEDVSDTLRQIEELSPDNLTVHSLAIKRAAKIKRQDEKNAGQIGQMIRKAAWSAEQMGMSPYYLYRQKNMAGNFENVGYAKVDKAGIYNILIMEEKQSIIAAGAGASTKILLAEPKPMPGSKKKKMTNLIRQENVKAVEEYIGRVDEMIERKGEWLWR